MKADLHTHTTFSDGKYSVKEILSQVQNIGLDYLSITDHDTFEGNRLAYNISLLPQIIIGIELSTYHNDESVHILGYFKNWQDASKLEAHLQKQIQTRIKRAHQLIKNLEIFYGLKLDISFLDDLNSITRASIARAMIKQKLASSYEEIFTKYLGDDCPAYIPSSHFPTKEGIKLIKNSGGLAVLAHPMELNKNNPLEIIKLGVDGLEAIYSNRKEVEAYYRKMAFDNKLFVTAGSDFHYYNDNQHSNLGDTYLEGEDLKIFLDKLYG